jgi:hypothetical protein
MKLVVLTTRKPQISGTKVLEKPAYAECMQAAYRPTMTPPTDHSAWKRRRRGVMVPNLLLTQYLIYY